MPVLLKGKKWIMPGGKGIRVRFFFIRSIVVSQAIQSTYPKTYNDPMPWRRKRARGRKGKERSRFLMRIVAANPEREKREREMHPTIGCC